jgi:uroporphyrinogen decarboxylase
MLKSPDPRNWTSTFPNKVWRDTYMKAVTFGSPDWIPCSVGFFDAVWAKYRQELKDLVGRHPFIFGTYLKAKVNYDAMNKRHKPNTKSTDNWDCTWQSAKGGYEGQVVGHPLANWEILLEYKFPNPQKKSEWGNRHWFLEKIGRRAAKNLGILFPGNGERLFDRLYFLRGFDNLMRDFATNDPHLPMLLQRFQDHEVTLVKRWLNMKVDIMNFHTDIGTQNRLMISPRQFRQWIKPLFAAVFQPCKDAGVPVYLSSDGYLLDIIDDLAECGVSVHDPQLRANTLEGIAEKYKGNMCVDLDLDRQSFPFAAPEELQEQIAKAVELLNSPEGGFMMKAEISDPQVPLENIEAICQAFEEYCIF